MKDVASGITLSVLKSKAKVVYLTRTSVKTVSDVLLLCFRKWKLLFLVCLTIGAVVP